VKTISLGDFQARRRGLREELDDLLPEPVPVEPDDDASAEEAELEAALQDARDFLDLPKTASREQVQACFGASIDAFSGFFFGHYHVDEEGQEIPPSRMHGELLARIQDLVLGRTASREEAFACPREYGKSVTGTLTGATWAAANQHRRFPFIFSDTGSQAAGFLEDVRDELEGNLRLRAVYPEFCAWEAPPRLNPHGLSRLVMANGTVIMAAGKGKSVRGARKGTRRPDWIILDDIESDEEVENPKRRAKTMRWYRKVAKKLGRAAVYLILGTILHAHSFLATVIGKDQARIYRAVEVMPSRMDLWEQWELVFHDRSVPEAEERRLRARAFYDARRAEMDEGAEVLWPGRFALYELMEERAEDLASFLSERQNDPFDPAACWFPEDKLVFLEAPDLPAPEDVVASVAMWDPSDGTTTSDTSAVPRIDALRDGRRLVSWALVDRVPPEEVIQTIVGAHKIRPFGVVGVEKVGLSSVHKDLTRVAREMGIALPVQAVTPHGSKDLRIRTQRPLVVSGGLVFSADLPREAVQQIKYYPQHPNDDLWDAIQQGNALLDELLAGVRPAASSRDPGVTDGTLTAADAFGRERLAGDDGRLAVTRDARGDGLLGGLLGNLLERMLG